MTADEVLDASLTAADFAEGQVVKSINGVADDVILAEGDNVTLTQDGQTITIASTGGGGTGEIADGSITSAKLAPDAVTITHLADNSVNTSNIIPTAVRAIIKRCGNTQKAILPFLCN